VMAFLGVLVMASVAFAAYPADSPCQATQRVHACGLRLAEVSKASNGVDLAP
jgi:hypothetical protein